jgi:hypothetical protein
MRRREFIAGLGGAAAWPLAGRAQQGDRMRRIGVLTSFDDNDPRAKAYLSGLIERHAKELVAAQPDVSSGSYYAGSPRSQAGDTDHPNRVRAGS